MATSRRKATNENISTYGGAGQGRDYTALTTWETATDIDLVAAAQSEALECYDDVAEFNDHVVLGGAQTNSSYFRILRPAGTIGTGNWEGHDGTPNNGLKFHNQGTTSCFDIAESNSSIQDLIVQYTNPDIGDNKIAIIADGGSNLLVGIIGIDFAGADGLVRGIRLETGGIAVNCININCDSWGFECNAGTCYFYNCNMLNNGSDGYFDGGGTATMKNCLSDGNGNEDFDSGGTYSNSGINASGDATAPGSSARHNQTFTFVNAGNNDYHLASNDAGAMGFGGDLSADGTFAFDDDIDGNVRT